MAKQENNCSSCGEPFYHEPGPVLVHDSYNTRHDGGAKVCCDCKSPANVTPDVWQYFQKVSRSFYPTIFAR